jgi:hypothetical protein
MVVVFPTVEGVVRVNYHITQQCCNNVTTTVTYCRSTWPDQHSPQCVIFPPKISYCSVTLTLYWIDCLILCIFPSETDMILNQQTKPLKRQRWLILIDFWYLTGGMVPEIPGLRLRNQNLINSSFHQLWSCSKKHHNFTVCLKFQSWWKILTFLND